MDWSAEIEITILTAAGVIIAAIGGPDYSK